MKQIKKAGEKTYTAAEVAEAYGRKPQTIYNWIRRGIIKREDWAYSVRPDGSRGNIVFYESVFRMLNQKVKASKTRANNNLVKKLLDERLK